MEILITVLLCFLCFAAFYIYTTHNLLKEAKTDREEKQRLQIKNAELQNDIKIICFDVNPKENASIEVHETIDKYIEYFSRF